MFKFKLHTHINKILSDLNGFKKSRRFDGWWRLPRIK